MKKRSRLAEILDTMLLLALVQSLTVPWAALNQSAPPTRHTNNGLDYDWLNPQYAYSMKGQQFGRLWRSEALGRILSNFYPRQITVRPLLTASYGLDLDQQPSTSNNELSLEDIDLIDVLWRQDIDLEKGQMPDVPTPDGQHERDLQLLTEKHFATEPFSTDGHWSHSLSKAYDSLYEELVTAEKSFKTLAPPPPPAPPAKSDIQLENVFDNCKEDPFLLSPDEENDRAVLNDVCLASANLDESFPADNQQATAQGPDEQQELEDIMGEFFTGPITLPQNDLVSPLEAAPAPRAMTPGAEGAALGVMQTPTLELTTDEMNRWFTDPQVVNDVATSLREQSTVVGMDDSLVARRQRAGPSTSSMASSEEADYSDVLVEPLVDEFLIDGKQQLPLTGGHSPNRPSSANQGGATASAADTVDHDHWYFAPDAAVEVVVGARDAEDEFSRLEGKLVPKLEPKTDFDDFDWYQDEEEIETKPIFKRHERERPKPYARGRQSKDEQLASDAGLPCSARELSTMTLPQFQHFLASKTLTPQQKELAKKIRRRGKNKVAARNCRTRRVNNMSTLETETQLLAQERRVESERNLALRQDLRDEMQQQQQLEQQIKQLNDER